MRFGVIGVGGLASVRVEALLATGSAELVAVAARRPERAVRFAAEHPGAQAQTVDELLGRADLDAALLALPHHVQDELVPRAIDAGLDVLIGGPLASTLSAGRRIVDRQRRTGVVVEAGYEARYKSVWRRSAEILRTRVLGELVSLRTNAGFDLPDGGWHSDQEASGGMLVTHLSYAFLNPLRHLLGAPRITAAIGSAKRFHVSGAVRPDTVMALAEFPGNVLAAMTASYVKPSDFDDWNLLLVGTDGALEIRPGDMDGGRLRLSTRDTTPLVETFPFDGFAGQAAAFARAVDARRGRESGAVPPLLNPAADAVIDLGLCADIDAIVNARLQLDVPSAP